MTNRDPHDLPPERPRDVNDPRRFSDLPPDAPLDITRPSDRAASYGGTWGLIAGIVAAILVVAFVWALSGNDGSSTADLSTAPATASKPLTTTPRANPPATGMNPVAPSRETTGRGAQ